jgi:hypothetical protein
MCSPAFCPMPGRCTQDLTACEAAHGVRQSGTNEEGERRSRKPLCSQPRACLVRANTWHGVNIDLIELATKHGWINDTTTSPKLAER